MCKCPIIRSCSHKTVTSVEVLCNKKEHEHCIYFGIHKLKESIPEEEFRKFEEKLKDITIFIAPEVRVQRIGYLIEEFE